MKKLFSLIAAFLMVGCMMAQTTLIDYNQSATLTEGVSISGTTVMKTVKIHTNTDAINCIQLANGYTTNAKYNGNSIILKTAGGFKAGDTLTVAGFFSNSDETKVAKAEVFTVNDTLAATAVWTSEQFINGRTSAAEPNAQVYVLAADMDSIMIGRNGNTGTNISTIKVVRPAGPSVPSYTAGQLLANLPADSAKVLVKGVVTLIKVSKATTFNKYKSAMIWVADTAGVTAKASTVEFYNVYSLNRDSFTVSSPVAGSSTTTVDTIWDASGNYITLGDTVTAEGLYLSYNGQAELVAKADKSYYPYLTELKHYAEPAPAPTQNYYLVGTLAENGWDQNNATLMAGDTIVRHMAAGTYEFKVLPTLGSWDGAMGYDYLDPECSSEGIKNNGGNIKVTLLEEGDVKVRVLAGYLCVTGQFGELPTADWYIKTASNNWTWAPMTKDSLAGIYFYSYTGTWGGVGANINNKDNDEGSKWFPESSIFFANNAVPAVGTAGMFVYSPALDSLGFYYEAPTPEPVLVDTVWATYKDYSASYPNYYDTDWGMVDGAQFKVEFYDNDSIVIPNWMNQAGYDLNMKYDAQGNITAVNNAYNDYCGWAYAGPGDPYDYYFYIYVGGSSWYDASSKQLMLMLHDGSNYVYYRLTWAVETGLNDVQAATGVQKVIENGKLFILKNGLKYNANGMLVK